MQEGKESSVLVVGSSGGHLLQVLSLKDWYKSFDRVIWATFDKLDARYFIGSDEQKYWLAFPTNRNLKNLGRNFLIALRVLAKERPDVIVSSGAGGAIPFFLLGKILGCKLIWIEVIDRIDQPSLTGRLVGSIADRKFVQWESQEKFWRDSELVGPLFPSDLFGEGSALEGSRRGTVIALGTHEVRWRRMEEVVLDLVRAGELPRPVLFQVGPGLGEEITEEGIDQVGMLNPDELFERMKGAEVVVTHGGPGCICMALAAGHRPLAVAREGEAGDAVDGHQGRFVRFLAKAGLVKGFESPQHFLEGEALPIGSTHRENELFVRASENAKRLARELKQASF